MFATQIILCATLIGNAALLMVVLYERPSLTRSVFALYVAFIAGWALTIYINLFLKSLLIEEWVFATAAGMLTAQFWFAKLFPEEPPPHRWYEYWSLALGSFFTLASFYPGALFTFITIHPEGYTTLDNGPLSASYSLFALLFVIAPAVMFFRKYRAATREPFRQQLKYLSIGFTTSLFVELLANSVLPVFFHVYTFNAVGPAFSLIFASIAFYIIRRHTFLDIRKVVVRGAIYSLVIGGVLIVDIILLAMAEQYLESIQLFTWIHADDVIDPLTAVLVTALGIATAPLIERRFQRMTDRIFFKDRYDYASTLESLSKILATSADFDELVSWMQTSLERTLRAEWVRIAFDDEKQYSNAGEPVEEGTLREPIVVGQEPIGSILVGPKSSGDRYRAEDQRLLRTFSLQASTALGRAQLFRQVQSHAMELEEKVAERTAELERAHENERHTLLEIAHGLQTPLTIFRVKLETLRSSAQGSIQLEMLEQLMMQLSEFVGDLLKLAQLEQQSNLHLDICDGPDLIRDICDEIETIATLSGIGVQRFIEPEIVLRADVRELRSAIMNIVSNSIKYMRNSQEKRISVRFGTQDSSAILMIGDTGSGIAAENLPYIFDRFYRVKNSTIAGNGLGLSLSRRIIERHGGTIEAASELGVGTTITIRLPCTRKSVSTA